MKYNPTIHHRQSVRLKDFDYASDGAYFVTICTANREHAFGDIKNGEMKLSDLGEIAQKCWQEIPVHFPDAWSDEWAIMPNHVHGIIWIENNRTTIVQNPVVVGVENFQPLPPREPLRQTNQFQKIIPRSIGSIVRGFKIGVTKWCRANDHDDFAWQRNYHEHIIRNESEMNRIRVYIQNNPANWATDENNRPG